MLVLPVIIHSREAKEDTLSILKSEAEDLDGVLHCYAYGLETADQAVDLGFYIAFGGIVTFNSAQELKIVVPNLGLDRLLFETDAPYLAPQAHRGDRNEPKYVQEVAETIADIKNVAVEKIAAQTTKNANKLFGLD